MLWLDDIALSQRRLGVFDAAFALLFVGLFPVAALGDEIFASVGNYGSGGEGANAVIQQAAQGVADRLNAQSPSFVLSLGDVLYGTYPSNTYFEFQPLGPTGNPSFEVAVGDLYGQYIKGVGSSVMNFFPVVGDHDWHHETIQIDEATGYSIGPAILGYNTTVDITTDPAFYTAAQTVYANAQTYLAGSNTNPSNTQFGLTTVYDKVTIFAAPDTPENGDTYETYFSGLYSLTTSQTASTAPVRWYDTLQGNVHIFALSTDPNELFQGGLNSIDIQDSGHVCGQSCQHPPRAMVHGCARRIDRDLEHCGDAPADRERLDAAGGLLHIGRDAAGTSLDGVYAMVRQHRRRPGALCSHPRL